MAGKIIIATIAFSVATAASAQQLDFAKLDTDSSGALSITEVQAIAPNVTVEKFAYYDTDTSGELSPDEFAKWATSSDERSAPQ